jgi:hypothetical protein
MPAQQHNAQTQAQEDQLQQPAYGVGGTQAEKQDYRGHNLMRKPDSFAPP